MFNKSWKTTLAGLIAAAPLLYSEVMAALAGQHINKKSVLTAVAIALMGYFARDKNVSTEQQAGVSPALIAACKDAGLKP